MKKTIVAILVAMVIANLAVTMEPVSKTDKIGTEEAIQPQTGLVLSEIKRFADNATGGIIDEVEDPLREESEKPISDEVELSENTQGETIEESEESSIKETGESEEPEEPEESEEETIEVTDSEQFYSYFSEDERLALAKTLYGEANSVESTAERAMVVWTILNRYDSPYFSGDIIDIVSAPMQFTGYSYYHPVTDRNISLVDDVIERYVREKNGEENVGRVLPADILFFHADSDYGWHNAFYKYEYGLSGDKIYFDRDCPPENPY